MGGWMLVNLPDLSTGPATGISILQRFWSVRYECVGTDSCDSGERARPAAVGSRGSSLEPFFGSRSFWDAPRRCAPSPPPRVSV